MDGTAVETERQTVALEPMQRAEPRLPPRVLGRLGCAERGATLVCVGGLHGNEPSGVEALRRVVARLIDSESTLMGEFVALSGNRQALACGRRYLERDLNRIWSAAEIERVADAGEGFESGEIAELAAMISDALAAARGRTYMLDLHSTSGPGPAFVVLEDTLRNRAFALAFPVTLVLGVEEELAGTLSGYVAEMGVTTVGFEAGQHDDPAAVDCAEAAVWLALAAAAIVDPEREEVVTARRRLEAERRDLPRVVEVRHRHAITAGDGFRMEPGFVSFEKVVEGKPLARDAGGPIAASESGRIVMPLYQQQGEDGFFLVSSVPSVWLTLSSWARRLRLDWIVHWLPGVHPSGLEPQTFDVDRRVARWLTLQLFHVLGFRRLARDEHWYVMSRRHHDV